MTLILCLTRLFLQLFFPLQLPDTEKFVKIPLVGRLHIRLSNITIFHVTYPKNYNLSLLHLLIVNTGEIGILREWAVIKRCRLCACVGVIKRCSFVLIKVEDHFAYFGLDNIDWGYLHVVNLWLLVTSSVLGVKIQAWKVICLSERNSVMYPKQAFYTDFSFWGTELSLWWETVLFTHLLHGFYFST